MAAVAEAPALRTASAAAPRAAVVSAVALAGCAAAALAVVLLLRANPPGAGPRAALVGWITLAYVICGAIAWVGRPDTRFGPLLVAAGIAPVLSTLSIVEAGIPYTIGEALRLLPLAVFLHLFLAYPSGRLGGGLERNVVAAAYAAAVGLQLVRMALGGFGPGNLVEIVERTAPGPALRGLQVVALSGLMLAGTGVLLHRRRGSGPPLRLTRELLVDCFAAALVMMAVALVFTALDGPATEPLRWVTFGLIGLAPVAFVFGLLGARLARTAVGELFVELHADPVSADLRDALARALGDPSLELAYWLPDFAMYVDSQGRPVETPTEGPRGLTVIHLEGEPVAALLHDSTLGEEPALLEAVTAAAAIALQNARLHAELRARLEELRGSRARVLEAGQAERKRLERNLHDGAQQRLIALSLELSVLGERLRTDPEARARLERAQAEIALSLRELRDVARGLHPAVVSAHGLEVALEQVTALAAVPVRLSVRVGERLPEQLEVAAFYLVAEALANIGKHAQATVAIVDVIRTGGRLSVEIVDDGVGAADTEAGTGLRGLADRVEALGGRLRIWSPRGGGTRVRAEIPCG